MDINRIIKEGTAAIEDVLEGATVTHVPGPDGSISMDGTEHFRIHWGIWRIVVLVGTDCDVAMKFKVAAEKLILFIDAEHEDKDYEVDYCDSQSSLLSEGWMLVVGIILAFIILVTLLSQYQIN